MTTLSSPALASDTLLAVDDVSEVSLDDVLLLDDEMVVVRGRPRAGSKVFVGRGHLGTERAAHESGTALEPYDASGAGLPQQWTIDENGNVKIAATPAAFEGENGFGGLILQCTDDNNTFDVLMIRTADETTTLGIDPFGFIAATGLDLTALTDVTVLKVDGSANTVHDVFQARDASGYKIQLTHDGRVLLAGLPASDPGVAGQVYSDGVPSAGVPKALKISGG